MTIVITLYDSRYSGNGWKVRQLLALLDRKFDRVVLNLAKGESREPRFLALNPLGRIPVLRTEDGHVIRESNAILLYLAADSVYLPNDPIVRSRIMQWLFFEQFDHLRNFARPRFLVGIAKTVDADEQEVVALRAQGQKALAVMDAHLAAHAYFAGDQYTVADIALYPYTSMAAMGGYDLTSYVHVRRWIDRIAARDGTIALP